MKTWLSSDFGMGMLSPSSGVTGREVKLSEKFSARAGSVITGTMGGTIEGSLDSNFFQSILRKKRCFLNASKDL